MSEKQPPRVPGEDIDFEDTGAAQPDSLEQIASTSSAASAGTGMIGSCSEYIIDAFDSLDKVSCNGRYNSLITTLPELIPISINLEIYVQVDSAGLTVHLNPEVDTGSLKRALVKKFGEYILTTDLLTGLTQESTPLAELEMLVPGISSIPCSKTYSVGTIKKNSFLFALMVPVPLRDGIAEMIQNKRENTKESDPPESFKIAEYHPNLDIVDVIAYGQAKGVTAIRPYLEALKTFPTRSSDWYS